MPTPELRLDRKAVGALLKSGAFAPAVNALANAIAENAGDDAEVEQYTTDRNAAAVKVPAWRQAKDGALTKAASAAGVQVVQKS